MIKRLLTDYLRTGMRDDYDFESNRKIFTVNLFGFVGLSITALMSISAFINQQLLLASVLILASSVYYLAHHYQKVTGNFHLASNIILYSLFALMVYLVYSGGKDNTGPLWIFMVSPVALFFCGLKRGLVSIAIFVICISVIMFYPDDKLLATTYSYEFKTRLLYSFLTITFLSGFYEYSRQQSFDFMQEMSNKYEQMAKLDPLTHISNRRDAMDRMEYEVRRVERNDTTLALILCDIDHFKQVNDKYGHDAGDKTLVMLANLFKETLRKQDIVSRWGGEEFLFILPQTSCVQARIVANKIRDCVNAISIEHNGALFEVTVSMGISEITKTNNNIKDAIALADNHLYKAKANGRDQFFPVTVMSHSAPAPLNQSA